MTYGNSTEPRQSGPEDQVVGPRDGITAQNIDNVKEGPELPPPPPPDRPRLTGAPGPLQDFTDYRLNGQPIPNPPAENVTAEDLRLRLLQQRHLFDPSTRMVVARNSGDGSAGLNNRDSGQSRTWSAGRGFSRCRQRPPFAAAP